MHKKKEKTMRVNGKEIDELDYLDEKLGAKFVENNMSHVSIAVLTVIAHSIHRAEREAAVQASKLPLNFDCLGCGEKFSLTFQEVKSAIEFHGCEDCRKEEE